MNGFPATQYSFFVYKRPYSVWTSDLAGQNAIFLRGFDDEFFSFVASTFEAKIGIEEDQHRTASALRLHYGHAAEAFFSFVGAFLQAPKGIHCWLPLCDTRQLKGMVQAIKDQEYLHNAWRFESLSWDNLIDLLLPPEHVEREADSDELKTLRNNYVRFWSRLSEDFLSKKTSMEYNAIKHGARVKHGGFRMSVKPTESPPEAEPYTFEGSTYGSFRYDILPIETFESDTINRQVGVAIRNWDLEYLVGSLRLIAVSLALLKGFLLRFFNLEPTYNIKGYNNVMFDKVLARRLDLVHFDFKEGFRPDPGQAVTKEQVERVYTSRSEKRGEESQ